VRKECFVKIYVGNLSYDATEENLSELFAAHGQVESVAIIKDHYSGRSRGFGFVEMAGESEGEAAIAALNDTEHLGRKLNVNEARAQTDGPRRGGGGGEGRQRQ
jgi:RNA recognition motif-containing protein